jgi:hypothetical protein
MRIINLKIFYFPVGVQVGVPALKSVRFSIEISTGNHTVPSKICTIFLSLSHDFWVRAFTTLYRTLTLQSGLRLSTWIKAVQPRSTWFSLVPAEKVCKCNLKKRVISFPSESLPINHSKSSYSSTYAVKKQFQIINRVCPVKLFYSNH